MHLPHLLLIANVFSNIYGFVSSRETVKYFIQEELESNHLIGNLMSLITLQSNTTNLDFIRFSILYQSTLTNVNGDLTKYFHIDEKTGEIFLSKIIDREQICPGADDCTIAFDVAVKPRSHFQIIKVRVEIADTNDNKPRFFEKRIEHRISEAAEPEKTSIAIPAATDPDSAENGIQRYFLVPDDGPFVLVANKINGETNLKLVLRTKLDREVEDQYFMKVYAIDGGKNPLTGSVEVEIVVLDANDNMPVFDLESYQVTIREDAIPGTILLRVRATDMDIGANGQVVYYFSSHVLIEDDSLFGISNHTGEIKLLSSLDYEKTTNYVLSVTASDLGQDATPSHVRVVFNIDDVNDNPPKIKLNPIDHNRSGSAPHFEGSKTTWMRLQSHHEKNSQSSSHSNLSQRSKSRNSFSSTNDINSTEYKFSIVENSPPNQLVAHVSVTDADSGENARTTCWLIGHSTRLLHHPQRNYFRLQQLYSSEFKLLSTPEASFNREEMDSHRVIIVCQDHGLPDQLTSSVEVRIEVLDINDNTPTFPSHEISISVQENKESGFLISKIRATDADSGENGRLTYALESDDKTLDLVRIDQNSGSLLVKNKMDREVTSELKFKVIARDSGQQPLSASAHVTLKIEDVDDEGPVFSADKYTFSIEENQPPGSSVGVLSARDPDQPPYDSFHYHLDDKEDSAFMFQLNPKTGLLSTSHILDRENCPLHRLIVYAISGKVHGIEKPNFSSVASVFIHVIDMNDHKPRFVYPSFNESIFLSNLVPRGYVVVQLKATDLDSMENANLSFYVISGNEDGKFRLDRFSGNLNVEKSFEGITYEEVLLGLKVKDRGDPPLSSYGELRAIISNKISFDYPSTAKTNSILDSATEILADETVAIVLAALLAIILVLISVFSVVIWMFGADRRRRHLNAEKQNTNSTNNNNKTKLKSRYFKSGETPNSQQNGLLGKELSQSMMTSLMMDGKTQTTVANGGNEGGQVFKVAAEDNYHQEKSEVEDECQRPIIVFIRDQILPQTSLTRTEETLKKPLFRRWENKATGKSPSSLAEIDVSGQREKYTDWYDNLSISQTRRILTSTTVPHMVQFEQYQTPNLHLLPQPDLIDCGGRHDEQSTAMPKLIGPSTLPPDPLTQSIEFHNWLNSSNVGTRSLTKFDVIA